MSLTFIPTAGTCPLIILLDEVPGVADEDPGVADFIRAQLAPFNVDVITYHSRMPDLATLEYCPNLILVDVAMPGHDGQPCISSLKQSRLSAEIPLIVLADQHDPIWTDHVRSMNSELILNKPIKCETLIDGIAQLIGLIRRPCRNELNQVIAAGETKLPLAS